ncbi:recombinase family protein [Sinanaerobacter sp. ZZT-01]|uniref:recombinase family protein n=1 Tax=Sinanaerobacter sp. ZZT-01 TaxID=3111540 RepID=UPI002D78137E|nr:recombinase family protein [Sinanaerobacter sp. ZZT-01]WRR93992.1 recombinase family protein [Sinanaerobacter sp. ZZT-01]
MEQKKRAWLYCRIDAPEDTHGTLKEQQKELWDYAEQLGLEVAGVSQDLGSGLILDRPGFNVLKTAAAEGRMDMVLVKSLSSIGRSMEQTLELSKQINQMGITLCSPLEGEIQLSSDTLLSPEPFLHLS